MLNIPLFLAHGALGWADEIVFAAVTVIFLSMMALQWVKSRTETFDDAETTAPSVHTEQSDDNSSDRFRLE